MRKNLAYVFIILGIFAILYFQYWSATYSDPPLYNEKGERVIYPGDYMYESWQRMPIYWGGVALFIVGIVLLLRRKKQNG